MAIKTFYHTDVSAGGFGQIDTISAPTPASTASEHSWFVDAAVTGNTSKIMIWDALVMSSDPNNDAIASFPPSAGNGFRSLHPINGTFAAGTWTLAVNLSNNQFNTSVGIAVSVDVYKGTLSDGSNAVLICEIDSSSSFCTTTMYTVSGTNNTLSAVTFNNEYLFMVLDYAAGTTNFGGDTGVTTIWTGSSLATPDFTLASIDIIPDPAIGHSAMSASLYVNLLDFGTYPGSNEASFTVTGQGGITSTSQIEAWLMAQPYASDHTALDATWASSMIKLTCGNIINGVGFTIYGRSLEKMQGRFIVQWFWV